MSGVAPIGPASDLLSNRDEERDVVEPIETVKIGEDKSPMLIKSEDQKQAEKTTLQAFQYTGKGSFIDKIF